MDIQLNIGNINPNKHKLKLLETRAVYKWNDTEKKYSDELIGTRYQVVIVGDDYDKFSTFIEGENQLPSFDPESSTETFVEFENFTGKPRIDYKNVEMAYSFRADKIKVKKAGTSL